MTTYRSSAILDLRAPRAAGRVRCHGGAWLAGLLTVLVLSGPGFAADITDPAVGCHLMDSHGLKARGGAEEVGEDGFRCASSRRSLPLGGEPSHEIRYFALGRAGRVQSLNLQLWINSRHENQAAHHRLLEYTTTLVQAALGVELPAEMATAILAGASGRFQINGNTATVKKAQIRGPLYELIVSLETGV